MSLRQMSDQEMRGFIAKHRDEVIEYDGVIRYRRWVFERQPSGNWRGYRP
ncbi:MAG: hypothetical protein KC910_19830 [Candidatus Eremiobacteraeota bacterium]|nr:hypothetical protein [Candidatus Eremiobacteraeota bacterium]